MFKMRTISPQSVRSKPTETTWFEDLVIENPLEDEPPVPPITMVHGNCPEDDVVVEDDHVDLVAQDVVGFIVIQDVLKDSL